VTRHQATSRPLGWAAASLASAALLSGAALALTAVRAPDPEPLFLTLDAAPPAALTIAAVADPAPEVVDEAPHTVEPAVVPESAAPDIQPPDPVAGTTPLSALAVPPADAPARADVTLPEPETVAKPRPKPKPDALTPERPPEDTPKPRGEPRTAKPEDAEPKPKEQPSASAGSTAPMAASKASGGKAVSPAAYARAVMQKVRATRKKSGAGKGQVVVGFSIAPDGGLAAVKVLQGSGNSALDQIAADHIRRAAPFPAPPEGVGTSFSFEFVGK
jgi:protein TonB